MKLFLTAEAHKYDPDFRPLRFQHPNNWYVALWINDGVKHIAIFEGVTRRMAYQTARWIRRANERNLHN